MVSLSSIDFSDCTGLQNITTIGTYEGALSMMSDIACSFGMNKGRKFVPAQSPMTQMPVANTDGYNIFFETMRMNQCEFVFQSFEKPTFQTRVCGSTANVPQTIKMSNKHIYGKIVQMPALVSEFCCGSSTINTIEAFYAFLASVYSSMKDLIDVSLYQAVYAPVETCAEGGRVSKTVLQEATDNNGVIDLSSATTLDIGMLLASVESAIRNKGTYVLFLPSSVYNYLNKTQINARQPYYAVIDRCSCDESKRMLNITRDCMLPTLNKLCNQDVIAISVPDAYVQKDTNGNYVCALINVDSLAAEVFAPKASLFMDDSQVYDLISAVTGKTGFNTRVFVTGPTPGLNYNSQITVMYGFVAGRIRSSDTFAVLVKPSSVSALAAPSPSPSPAVESANESGNKSGSNPGNNPANK